MTTSLRRKLIGWITVVTVVSGVVAGVLAYYQAFREAREWQDDQLQQLALVVGHSGGAIEPWSVVTKADARHDPDARIVILPLQPAARRDARANVPSLPVFPADLPEGLQTVNGGGDTWRLYVQTLPAGSKIAVGQLTAVRDEAARNSGLCTLIPILFLVPFLSLLAAWVVRRSLAPITELSRQLDHRDDTNLHPLAAVTVPDEISPFVASINGLIQRLSVVFEQQRRFIADAAHELRSPLTALILQAENLRNDHAFVGQSERFLQLTQGLARARALLEQLLSLGRQQFGAGSSARIRLDIVVRQVLEDVMPRAVAKGIDLGCERLDRIDMDASLESVTILMRNVIDNAVRYTQPGGKVDIVLRRDEDRVVFQVADNGPGIPPGEEERVFEPFYRGMGGEETGSGLGLAIVRSIAGGMGGAATLRNRDDGRGVVFRFTCVAGLGRGARAITSEVE